MTAAAGERVPDVASCRPLIAVVVGRPSTSPSTVTDCTPSDGRSRGPCPRVTPPKARRRRRDAGPGRSRSVPQRSPHCRHRRGHQAAARPDGQRTVRSRRGRRRCESPSTRMATIGRATAAANASCASARCDARGSAIRGRPLCRVSPFVLF